MVVIVAAGVFAVASASAVPLGAGPGNSAAAKMCQKGGWQNYVRTDGTAFKNTGACVSYAARGFALTAACTAGSENFSEYALSLPATPSTFSGGTIDTAYGTGGGVLPQGTDWLGAFADGSYLLFSGSDVDLFQLTFTSIGVDSVTLDAESSPDGTSTNLTLTGYDASGNVVGTPNTAVDNQATAAAVAALAISSASNNIKYFTIATNGTSGLGFTNITWGCAAAAATTSSTSPSPQTTQTSSGSSSGKSHGSAPGKGKHSGRNKPHKHG